MNPFIRPPVRAAGICAALSMLCMPARAEISAEELANVVHPDHGANWQLRAQVPFMVPK
jgi:hypothetical protein